MTPDTAWAAGFLDWGARISVTPTKSDSPRVVVVIEQRAPVARLHSMFGGTLTHIQMQNKKGKKKQMFRWEVRGVTAMRTLVEVLPGLHLQNERARSALYYAWYDTPNPGFWKRLFSRKKRFTNV